jgi:LPS export ABC transporter protein LptC
MTLWQRRLRLALGLFMVVFAAALFFSLRRPAPRPAAEASGPAVDPRSVAQFVSGVLTHAKGTRQQYDLHYDQLLTYQDGRSRFLGVRLRVPDREGREFRVTAREAEAESGESQVVLRGDVAVAGSDGLEVRAQEAFYQAHDGSVRAPGHVVFSRGRFSGSATGMTFDRERDVLALHAEVRLTAAAGAEGAAAAIEAGSGLLERRERRVRLDRAVKIVREAGTLEADQAVGYLTEDEQQLERLELRGSSRMTGGAGTSGGLRAMTARDIDLIYGADGETLERARLVSDASIELAGDGGAPGRRLAGEHIDVVFGPEGEITALAARDRVELTLPADATSPARVIRSAGMEGKGPPGQGLTAATFTGGVEFREAGAQGPERLARARTLVVAMDPASGAIQDARFSGSTRFEEGALRASAVEGRYRIANGVLELTGSDGPSDPRVEDERMTVDAKRIELTFEGPKLVATTEVRSVLRPAPKKPAGGSTAGPSVPGLLKDDQPVYITGERLQYDGARSFAEYVGGARLWQGDTTILGDRIVLDEGSGDLRAYGGEKTGLVRSTLVIEQVDEKTGKAVPVPSVASARELHYDDAARRGAT